MRTWFVTLACLTLGALPALSFPLSPAGAPSETSTLTSAAPLPPQPELTDKDKRQAADESKQGAAIAAEVAKTSKFVTDPAILMRVNRIGQSIAAVANTTAIPAGFGNNRVYPFTWHFFVIKDKDVNAFSLPGGYVYINSGTLAFIHSDDELAGVLGHEITHAAHHHIQALSHEQSKMNTEMMAAMLAAIFAHVPANDMANLYQGAAYTQMGILNNKYSEAAEQDADHGGVIYMTKAGYDPVGMLTFMQRLEEQEQRSPTVELGILRDHPYTDDRVTAINTELTSMHVAVTPQAIRSVTNAARAVVVPLNNQAVKITFGGQPMATISDPEGDRARRAADLLNSLLDNGLQMYEVKAENNALVVADRPILTFTSADTALQPGSDPQTLATDASQAIRKQLWAQAINGNSVSY